MHKPETDWLDKLDAAGVEQEKQDKRQAKRDAVLAKMSGRIEEAEARLHEIMDLTISNDEGKEQDTLDFKKRDQLKEFDLDDQQDGFSKLSPADLDKHTEASQRISSLYEQLAQEVDDEGNPLFDKDDLTEELYSPLKRQGLLPETFIPDEHSETHEMVKETFDLYKERLENEEEKGFLGENKDLIMAGVNFVITGVGSGVSLDQVATQPDVIIKNAGHWDPGSAKDMASNYAQNYTGIVDGSNKLSQTVYTTNALSMALGYLGTLNDAKNDIGEAIKPTDPTGRKAQASMGAEAIAAGVASNLGSKLAPTGIGTVLSSTFGTFLKTGDIKKEIDGDTFEAANVNKIVDLICASLKKTMDTCDPNPPDTTAAMKGAGTAMANEFAKVKTKAAEIVKALQDTDDAKPDFSKVLQIFAKAAEAAATAGLTPELKGVLANNPENQKKARQKIDDAVTAEIREQEERDIEEAKREKDELDLLAADKTKSEQLAIKLEKKIAVLNRNRAILKWAVTISTMGLDQAAQAIAPLALAGGAIKVAQNIYQAVRRHIDWANFCEKHQGMLKAASAYSAPVANFVGNSRMQAIHYDINAGLEVAKMIGAAIQCSGIIAPAGVAVSASANSAQALENLLYEAKKRWNLEQAWKTYKIALVRSENRKLGLIAMKQNPTLAKYAVAWGSVIKKDPLVGDFMGACGLNPENLKLEKKNENVERVVKYLEARLPDDISVVGRTVAISDWAPSPVELTLTCWSATKKRAEVKAEMVKLESPELDVALARFKPAHDKIKPNLKTAAEEEISEYREILGSLRSGFLGCAPRRYADPKKKETVKHAEMYQVIEQFKDQVDALLDEVKPQRPQAPTGTSGN